MSDKRRQASYQFQAPDDYRDPSMPFEVGDKVRVGSLAGVFEVLGFDGSTYRIRAESGAELRAGRKAVRADSG